MTPVIEEFAYIKQRLAEIEKENNSVSIPEPAPALMPLPPVAATSNADDIWAHAIHGAPFSVNPDQDFTCWGFRI